MRYCRSCGSQLSNPFLNLGNSPLANHYLTEDETHLKENYYPLEVYYCHNCSLVQIDEFERPDKIFSQDYAYFSSYSQTWLNHCKNYAEIMIKKFKFSHNSFILEIGSNDGYLLQYFKNKNIPVRGVEPAKKTAEVAMMKGIPTDITFFNSNYAKKMASDGFFADLIIGNNVLAHNPNLNDFIEGLRIILKPNGIITLEFPYILQLIHNNQFDTIYHEHYSYFSLHSVLYLLNRHDLDIFDVEELSTHGGSLRIYIKAKNNQTYEISPRFYHFLEREKNIGLLDPKYYEKFRLNVERVKRTLLHTLISIKNDEKLIVGYGAAAKGNTLLNYCGIRTDFLEYVVDKNPHKQNRYLPGSHIPIKSPEQILIDKPDYIFILPWNIKDEIIHQLSYIRDWGGKFIVPIPQVEVISV